MNDITLQLTGRTATGKRAKALRRDGIVPSIVYGATMKPLATQSAVVETTKLVRLAGKHTPIALVIDGKKKLAMLKEIERDPVTRTLRHVAFHAIKQNDIITAEVPVVLTHMGESEAEKLGLVILQTLDKVEIKAKPADLPESFEVSVGELATIDDKLTLGDVVLPKGVEFADAEQDLSVAIAAVYEPSALQAANEATGGDAEESMPAEGEAAEEAEGADEKAGSEAEPAEAGAEK